MNAVSAAPEQLAVVLVRARNPLNIGAAARAMTDFGCTDLRVVSEYAVPFQNAVSAVDAAPVLQAAQPFTALADAVADCTLVYGTTALGARKLEHPVDLLPDAAQRIAANSDGKIALLFGSEKTGLSNDELSFCHRLLTIPMHRQQISMNLGQAVAVCLYEVAGRGSTAPRELPTEPVAASAEELERMETLLREVLRMAEYDRRFPGNLGSESMRRLLRRLSVPGADVGVWLGMLRRIRWKLQQNSLHQDEESGPAGIGTS